MATDRPRFSVALSDDISARDAREILQRLAHDDEFREAVRSDPRSFYAKLGIEVGDGLIPDRVVLPLKNEVAEALEILENYEEFRFKFEPFGFFTPGKNPFIFWLLLSARAASKP